MTSTKSPATTRATEAKVVYPGSAVPAGPAPVTPKALPHRGAPENPSAVALRAAFGEAVRCVDVVWGETNVVVARERLLDIVRWLHDDPG
ncbi:MAG TPA: hypothetical protein VFA55_05130, partial [Candidatus Kapabacteria bacterium]|nr:hypothetical protein [Candidatus Kapabacteria bacterium]